MVEKAVYVDGVLRQWGDRAFIPYITIRQGKAIRQARTVKKGRAPAARKPSPPKNGSLRQQLLRTTKKTPEVMVKISGGGKDVKHIKAHLDYITRHGKIEIEDESGNVSKGKQAVLDIRDSWAYGGLPIPSENGKQREAFNIILSMPSGTDRDSVSVAAKEFAHEQFGNHQFAFVTHKDEAHPHVHLVVKAVDRSGVRLNPRKADIQEYRQRFAEKLRDNGIEANATSRFVRGKVQKGEKQVIRRIDRRLQEEGKGRAAIVYLQNRAVKEEVISGIKEYNPASDKNKKNRESLTGLYNKLTASLAAGEGSDKTLSKMVSGFQKALPKPITRHEEAVLRYTKGKIGADKNQAPIHKTSKNKDERDV